MKVITDERCTGYRQPGHPERPERISATLRKLREQDDIKIAWGKPAEVEESSLLRAHTAEHLARLAQDIDFDGDTPFLPNIPDYARAAAGAGLEAMRVARSGENVFSLMRPPGHHAMPSRAMGFCYLSNIAIAALEAVATGAKLVVIYDFDVHHGNGTEAVLMNKPNTAFISIHQYPCYPGTGGRNLGGNCFNYPVPPQTPRGDYRLVLETAFNQLRDLKPDLVGVSAGFDAYFDDPLAEESLEAEDFHWLGQSFRKLGVPVFSLLEGGYSDELPQLIFAYLKGLEGK